MLNYMLRVICTYWFYCNSCGKTDIINESKHVLTVYSPEDLICHLSDLFNSKGHVVILLQEIKGAQPQQLKHDADVTVVVKPVQHPYTRTKKIFIFQHFYVCSTFKCI